MPIDTRALIDRALRDAPLEILLFGPAVAPKSTDPFIAGFQSKRVELRDRLKAEGHNVYFGEKIFDASLPAHLADPFF